MAIASYQGSAVGHIWVLTTLLGCDWDLLSTSYTCLVNIIHIKGVWHTLYAVDGHTDTTPACMTQEPAAVCYIDSGY